MRIAQLLESGLPQLVIFDLDGTLVDSAPDLAWAADALRQELGMPPAGLGKVRQWVGNGIDMLVRRTLADSLESDKVAAVDDTLLQQSRQRFVELYRAHLTELTQPYPGVESLLAQLEGSGVVVALATNKSEALTLPMLVELNWEERFQHVVCGDTLEAKKPDPLPLQHLMTVADCQPEHTLMVGDSRNDIEAARAAGVKVVAVEQGYNHGQPVAESRPDWLYAHIGELL